jgi:hypothetical protein
MKDGSTEREVVSDKPFVNHLLAKRDEPSAAGQLDQQVEPKKLRFSLVALQKVQALTTEGL